jgi:hypothetical protein
MVEAVDNLAAFLERPACTGGDVFAQIDLLHDAAFPFARVLPSLL